MKQSPTQHWYYDNNNIQVLQVESTNKKALYRRAVAYQAKEDYDQAFRDIDAAWNSVKNTT